MVTEDRREPAEETTGENRRGQAVLKKEFGRRIERLMLDKGWNRSELARQASKFLPKGDPMGRDSVGNYVRGRTFPGPTARHAIAQALGVTVKDLMPSGADIEDAAAIPALEMRQIVGHPEVVELRINQRVPFEDAVEIMRILSNPKTRQTQ